MHVSLARHAGQSMGRAPWKPPPTMSVTPRLHGTAQHRVGPGAQPRHHQGNAMPASKAAQQPACTAAQQPGAPDAQPPHGATVGQLHRGCQCVWGAEGDSFAGRHGLVAGAALPAARDTGVSLGASGRAQGATGGSRGQSRPAGTGGPGGTQHSSVQGAPGQDGAVAHKRHQPQRRQLVPQRLRVLHTLHVRLQGAPVLLGIQQARVHIPAIKRQRVAAGIRVGRW